MSKDIYKVTIASGKGQPLAVVLTPHPEIVRIIRNQWSSDKLLSWRGSGPYRLQAQKLDPMDFIAGNVKGKRTAAEN
jgi:hypothetical protein